jgi:hypothetical protein
MEDANSFALEVFILKCIPVHPHVKDGHGVLAEGSLLRVLTVRMLFTIELDPLISLHDFSDIIDH